MKNKFITGLVAAVFVFSSAYGTGSFTKEERWDNMAIEVSSWTDGLGLPIDDGIKDTVIALNLLGVQTSASCEGHDNWGTISPWVDIELNISSELMEALGDIGEVIEKAQLALQEQYPDLSWGEIGQMPESEPLHDLYFKRYNLGIMIDKELMERITPLLSSLAAFYETRTSPYDCKITLAWYGSTCRLESEGARWQRARSETERAEKLAAYQQEMNAFTLFLKANLN